MFTESYPIIDTPLAAKIKMWFLLMLLLATAVPIASPPMILGGHGQPALLQLATAQPNAVIQVTVQKTTNDDTLENLVMGLGGTIIKEHYLTNTLIIRLPVRALPQLATTPVVRWISLDRPVESAGAPSIGNFITPITW